MLWVPQKGVLRVEHNLGTVGSANMGTAVTASGTSSVKGTAVQLIASTSFDAYWIRIIAGGIAVSATNSASCLDILTGAATEDVLIANLLAGHCGTTAGDNVGPKYWDFPLYIPAGTRIAAQLASARVSQGLRCGIILYGGDGYPPFRVGSKVTTYGIGTVPNGTTITVGASGAEGAFAQITASTSENHFAIVPSFQPSTTTCTAANQFVDIGVGSATEEEIAQSYVYQSDSAERHSGPWNSMPCFQDIPSGSRLAMRASASGTADTSNGALHGVS